MTTRELTQLRMLEIANALGTLVPQTSSQHLAVGFLEGTGELERKMHGSYMYWEITSKGRKRFIKETAKRELERVGS